MKAYKGFNKDMTCRGFQFKEGDTYTENKAKLCESGFHACLNPLDCWNYYELLNSEFREVELEDVSDERENDTKVCAKRITIGAKLDIKCIVKASVDFMMDSVKDCFGKEDHTSGNYAQIGSSGDYARIGSSGDSAQIGSSGNYARIDLQGKNSVAACVGNGGKIKGGVGCWIVLSEWRLINDEYAPACVKAAQIDGEKLKPDVWYELKDGEIVESE